MSKLSEEEKSLFDSAMQGVSPIKQSEKHADTATQTRKVRQQQIRQQQKKQRFQSQNSVSPETLNTYEKFDTVSAFDSLLFHRKGLRLQDLARLKKGEYPIEAELDLHGLTEEAADQTLQQFIQRCAEHEKRCVIIIHGKGYNSESSAPVLKNLVNMRLRQMRKVLAFCSSLPKDGGTGSVYVLLKAANSNKKLR